MFPKVYKGTHVSHPAVTVRRARPCRLPPAGVDGVRRRRAGRAAARCTCEAVPGALHVLSQRGRRRRSLGGHGHARRAVRRARRRRGRGAQPRWPPSAAGYDVRARPVPGRGLRGAGGRARRAGRGADRRRQDRRRRVRRPPGPAPRAASASTRRRSRRCPTRSTPTSSRATAPTSVGLLTGDNTVNGEAPVVVMTTEVLRNMLYAARRRCAASATS